MKGTKIILILILFFGTALLFFIDFKTSSNEEQKIYISLADALKDPEKVYILDLSSQSLKRLPEELTALKNLQALILNNNNFEEIPKVVFEMKDLRKLICKNQFPDPSKNKGALRIIPPEIQRLKNLEVLDLSDNAINSIPDELLLLPRLKNLNLSSNHFYSQEDIKKICKIKTIEELALGGNFLKTLPAELINLPVLKSLDLGFTTTIGYPRGELFDSLPSVILRLKNLEALYFDEQEHFTFPEELCHLKNLKILDISGLKMHKLPNNFSSLINLEEFYFHYHHDSVDLGPVCRLKKLKKLYFSGYYDPHADYEFYKGYISSEISNLKNLEELDLSYNFISRFPPLFGKLKKLKYLDLSCNYTRQEDLEMISKLDNLEYLNLTGNEISELPDSFGKLLKLKSLVIDNRWAEGCPVGSSLKKFPKVIFSLTRLENLVLSGQGIDHIPKEIGKLKKLRRLNLYANSFKSLPESIDNLRELEYLNIGLLCLGPDLKLCDETFHLPRGFCKLKKLKVLATLYTRKIPAKELENFKLCLPQCVIE